MRLQGEGPRAERRGPRAQHGCARLALGARPLAHL